MKTGASQVDTAAFKRAAVRLGTHPGSGVSEAAHHLGSHTPRLGRWQRQAAAQEHGARAGHGRRSRAPEELARGRTEHTRLRRARDLCKNTVSVWASASTCTRP